MLKIQGLYTAIISPFDAKGNFDTEKFRSLIRFQVAACVDGITVLGTTGEAPTLSHKEKELAFKVAREETQDKCHLMVGTGSYATQQTIENTRFAKEHGADSALIVTPYYNRPTQEGIFRHFKAITEAVDLPIVVYNHQPRTGQNILPDTLLRIASLPKICAVKEASGQLQQMMDVVEKICAKNPYFSLLSGDDQLTYPSIAIGGSGVISVISNLIPIQMQQLVTSALKGDCKHALELHYALTPLFKIAGIETNPMPLKAAMAAVGFITAGCRLPLCELLPENQKKLEELLKLPEINALIDFNKALYTGAGELACAG